MFNWLFKKLAGGGRSGSGARAGRSVAIAHAITREDVRPLLTCVHGMPHVDWGMAAAWCVSHESKHASRDQLRLSVAAFWLDELRDAMADDAQRWNRGPVLGVAPMERGTSRRLADTAEKALGIIDQACSKFRAQHDIPPIAVIALGTRDEYYSFIAHFFPSSKPSATSGGLYIRSDGDSFPMLVINPLSKDHSIELTAVHELTHHVLADCRLPLFIEEGLTQMMEERATGIPNFTLDHQRVGRHREVWTPAMIDEYVAGSTFLSPTDDVQELSYHLSQWIVRSLLDADAKKFFAFAKACQETPVEFAMQEHLGVRPEELVARVIGR